MSYQPVTNQTFIPYTTPVPSTWLNGVNNLVNGFIPISQSGTEQIYAQHGAKINRFGDRLFVGDAVVNDGLYPTASPDWLSVLQTPTFGVNGGAVPFAMLASLTNNAGGSGITAGAQTKYFTNAGSAAIGIQAFGYANNGTYAADAWGYYGEAHRLNNGDGNIYGIEIAVCNQGNTVVQLPYDGPVGLSTGIQIDSGNSFGTAQLPGQSSASSAITIVQNTSDNSAPFLRGIIFSNNSLKAYAGGLSEAISFYQGNTLQWYAPGDVQTSSLLCSGTTQNGAQEIAFQEGNLGILQRQNGAYIASFGVVSNAVNYLFFTGSTTGNPPVIAAGGSDVNINLKLQPQGSGLLQFGTYTAGTFSQTGYITIVDAGGTTRRLMVG